MADKKKKTRKKKIRYKTLAVKITREQFEVVDRYCRKHKLTPNKLMKKALWIYIDRFGPLLDIPENHVSDNQLSLF